MIKFPLLFDLLISVLTIRHPLFLKSSPGTLVSEETALQGMAALRGHHSEDESPSKTKGAECSVDINAFDTYVERIEDSVAKALMSLTKGISDAGLAATLSNALGKRSAMSPTSDRNVKRRRPEDKMPFENRSTLKSYLI